jgi:outer membrane receptor protein involved in Fe transport
VFTRGTCTRPGRAQRRLAPLWASALSAWLGFGAPPSAGREAGPPPAPAEDRAEDQACEVEVGPDGACLPAEVTTVIRARRPPPPGTRTTLDADEIALRGARNLAEALAAEPSVEIQLGPKSGATLQIRGFDERASLVLFEGIPIREVYDGHFDIASLPVFTLGSITLERGVSSLLHGPNALGGVLSLEAPLTCPHRLDASVYAGRPAREGFLLYGGRVKACHASGDFSLHLGAGYERSEGYVVAPGFEKTPGTAPYHEDGGLREGSDYQRSNAGLVVQWAPRRNKRLRLFLSAVDAPRGVPLFEGSGYLRTWRFAAYDTLLVGLSGTWGPEPERLSRSWGFQELRAQVYAHVHRDELRDYEDTSYTRLTSDPLAWFVASAYANETYGAVVQTRWALIEGNRLDLSLRYHLDAHRQREIPVPRGGVESGWGPWARYAAHTYTAAVEDTQVLGAFRLTAGIGAGGLSLAAQELRGTSYAVAKRVLPGFEGRLVLEYTLLEGLQLVAAAGHKVRYPMLKELFSNSVGGNPALGAERAWMVEAGFDSQDAFLRGLDLSARGFFNDIRDLITRYREAYANVGHARIAGVELSLRYRPVELVRLDLGYRYLHTRDEDQGRPLDYRTPHRLVAGARLRTGFGLTLGLQAAYNSGQEATYVDPTSTLIREELPAFVLLEAHLRFDLPLGERAGVYLFADGFNLLNQSYFVGSFEPRAGAELLFGIGGRV